MKSFFISSTFKDMQAERDILHERVFPKLRQIIRKYGDEVQEVDLRWGVDTMNMSEEDSGHEVLRICIDAIDRCKPYLIVLLGERYGWIPGRDIVDGISDYRMSDKYEDEMSITELEIQYGALLDEEAFEKCIFCVRDSSLIDEIDEDERCKYTAESEQHRMRLKALKKLIRNRRGAIVLDYSAKWDAENKTVSGLEDFESSIFILLKQMIEKDFSGVEPLSYIERLREEVELIKGSYLSSYVRRYPEEFELLCYIGEYQWNTGVLGKDIDYDCVLLSGAAGSGKSALMAFMSEEAGRYNIPVISCFAAASGCRTPVLLKSYIIFCLEEILSEPHIDEASSADERLRQLNKKAVGKEVVCFVDAIDQIYSSDNVPYIDLVYLCPDIFWVFSTLEDFPYEKSLDGCSYKTVKIGGMTPLQCKKMIIDTAGRRGKKLGEILLNTIAGNKSSKNPLYVSLVLQRLFMMNKREFEQAENIAPGMEGLHRYMETMISEMPSEPEKMVSYILDITAKMFEQKDFLDVLVLIALSKNGLTENELSELLEIEGKVFSPLGFQQIVSYLYDGFCQNSNGKWTFSHRLFKEAVISSVKEEDKKRLYDLLVRYSSINTGFMESEGFCYLLESKSDTVSVVLEKASGWKMRDEVYNEVGCLARDSAKYRSFFKELADKYPSEGLAEFWLTIQDYVYGEEVENMVFEIIKILSEKECIKKHRYELILRGISFREEAEALAATDKALLSVEEFQEGEKNLAYAGVYTFRMRILAASGHNDAETENERERAITYIEKAFEGLKDSNDISSYRKLFEYMKSVFRNSLSMNSKNTPGLLMRALEINDRISSVCDCNEVMINRVTVLFYLCKMYSGKQFRDNDKIKEYGDLALEIIDKAVSESPTVENLDIKMYVVYACAERLREEYQYPLLEQAVECARRLYTTVRDDYYKKELAYAEAKYASSLGKAVNTISKVTSDDMHKCDEVWDHSFSLFEELISTGYDRDDIISYAAYLVARGEILCERGYYDNAFGFYKRAEEILSIAIKNNAKKACNASPSDALRCKETTDWCKGWLARVNGGMANVHMAKLELAECVCRAKAGAQLSSERSSVVSAYYKRTIDYTYCETVASYYLRRDEDALLLCDKLENLIASDDDVKTEPYIGEINYIRSRIALEKGELDKAELYYQRSAEYTENSPLLRDKLLILKADILTFKSSDEAKAAWQAAYGVWKERTAQERSRFEKDYEYKIYTKNGKSLRRVYRRESRSYAITSYYMVYCLYHCITDASSVYEFCGPEERTLCSIVEMTGKGVLSEIRPLCFKPDIVTEAEEAEEYIGRPADTDDFLNKLSEIAANRNDRDMSVYKFIERNVGLIAGKVPSKEQFDILIPTAEMLYDRLFRESVAYNQAVAETELFMKAFPVDEGLPVFCRDYLSYRVWSEKQISSRCDDRRALMRLLLFLLRYDSCDWDIKRKLLDNTMIVYRVIASMNGEEKDISRADISTISSDEILELVSVFKMEKELRIRGGFRYWYELKNIWHTELYIRTGNIGYIDLRLSEFDEFLTDKYEDLYQSYSISEKKDMSYEISRAAMNFINVLACNGANYMSIKTAKWFESKNQLRGKMLLSSVKCLKATNEEDERWISELVMRQSEQWISKASDGLWGLRMYI